MTRNLCRAVLLLLALPFSVTTAWAASACRAFFQLNNGLTAGEPDSSQQTCIRAFVLNFGENSETTGIIQIENGKWKFDNETDAWYSIDGRKLNGKPTTPGIYICNGKKLVVK